MDKEFLEYLIHRYPIYEISVLESNGEISVNIKRPKPELQLSTWVYGNKVRIGDIVESVVALNKFSKGEKFHIQGIPNNNTLTLIHESGLKLICNKGCVQKK